MNIIYDFMRPTVIYSSNRKETLIMRHIVKSIKETLKQKIRDVCRVEETENVLDTLYYFLNNSLDIRDWPKATGNIRQLQLADTELLRIFHDICQKHNLVYWIDYGTLLGAVRHKGFIPWDDDVDVVMPRKDYKMAEKIIPEEFAKIGYSVAIKRCIYIYHEKTGTAIDIFAMDSVEDIGDRDQLIRHIRSYKTWLVNSNYGEKGNIHVTKEKMIGKESTDNPIFFAAPEQVSGIYVHRKETIYPLKMLPFEDIELFAPNNVDQYLIEEYGDYMTFPRSGVLHHGKGDTKLFERAEKNHIDMNEYIEQLKAITIASDIVNDGNIRDV